MRFIFLAFQVPLFATTVENSRSSVPVDDPDPTFALDKDDSPYDFTYTKLMEDNPSMVEASQSGVQPPIAESEAVALIPIPAMTVDESNVYRSSLVGVNGTLIERPYNFTGNSTYALFARGLSRKELRAKNKGSFGFKKESGKYSWMTYEDMDSHSQLLGNGLVNMGLVEPIPVFDQRKWRMVGVYSEHRLGWTELELAASRQNITLVPIYETSKPDFLRSILEQTQVGTVVVSVNRAPEILKLLVSQRHTIGLKTLVLFGSDLDRVELYRQFPGIGVSILTLAEVKGAGSEGFDSSPRAEDVNTICFTSGTTGEPKGILVTHKMLIAVVGGAMKANLGLNYRDVHVAYLPPAHIFERIVDLAIMYSGAKIGYYSGEMKTLGEDIRAIRPTLLVGVPRVFEKTVQKIHLVMKTFGSFKQKMIAGALENSAIGMALKPRANLSFPSRAIIHSLRQNIGGKVRLILSGGGPLAPSTQESLKALFHVPVVQGYGMTETAGGTLVTNVYSKLTGVVGVPVGCVEVKLADLSIHEPRFGKGTGELYVRGPAVFSEYFNNTLATQESITSDGWVKTGDIAVVVEEQGESAFRIVGRAKEIFKLETGEYVVPSLLESQYKACPLVEEIFIDPSVDGKATVAVVNVKTEALVDFQKQLEESLSLDEILENEKFHASLLECLRMAEAKISRAERLRNVHLSPVSFGAETEFQTATMKLKRAAIRKAFEVELAKL